VGYAPARLLDCEVKMHPTVEIVPCGLGSGFWCDAMNCTEEATYDVHTPAEWLVLCTRHMRDVADQLGAQVPESA
jgi:hypothetical protein